MRAEERIFSALPAGTSELLVLEATSRRSVWRVSIPHLSLPPVSHFCCRWKLSGSRCCAASTRQAHPLATVNLCHRGCKTPAASIALFSEIVSIPSPVARWLSGSPCRPAPTRRNTERPTGRSSSSTTIPDRQTSSANMQFSLRFASLSPPPPEKWSRNSKSTAA